MGMSGRAVIGIALSVYVLAAVLPGAFNNFFGANTTAWDVSTVALWGLIPLFIVIALVMKYYEGDAA